MGLVGLANRYPPQDVLLSDRSCDTSAYNCFSMDELYASFVAKARIVADLSLASLSYDDPAFVDMTLMLEPLVEKLDMSIELIEEEYFPSLASLPLALDVLLALSYPLALAEVLFMLWASRSMINNIDQLRSLLRSLPRSVIAKSPLVDRYLRTGILRTDVQITGKAQKTNNGEDEEDDANLKIRPSNDLKDSALSFNDQPGLFKDGDLPRAAAASLMDTHPGKPSLSGLTTPFIDDGTDADDESHRDTAIESAMYRTRLAGATPPALATDDRRKMLAGSTPAAITSNDRAGYRIGDDTTSSGSNNIYTDADQDFARTLASSKPPSFRLKTLPPHKMALHGSKRSAELDPGELLGVAAEGMVSDKNRGHAKGSRASFSSLGAMTVDSIDGSHRASRESRLGSSSASASSGIDEEKPDDGEEVGGSLYPMTSKVFHERHASSSSSSSGETAAAAHNAAVPPALNKTKMGASSSSSSGILRRSTLDGLTAPSLPERQRSPLRNSNVRFAERDEEIDEYGKRASK